MKSSFMRKFGFEIDYFDAFHNISIRNKLLSRQFMLEGLTLKDFSTELMMTILKWALNKRTFNRKAWILAKLGKDK